jgi:hypothetical protein
MLQSKMPQASKEQISNEDQYKNRFGHMKCQALTE